MGHLYRIEELVLIDLGTVSKESMAMTSFRILNDTAQDLVVVRIKPDCSCTTVGEATLEGDSRPTVEYLNWILTGAQEHGLPVDYIQWIKLIASA